MSGLSIINSVFGELIADSTFLDYFGLTTASDMPEKMAKIQKEMEPNELTSTNIPLACIYPVTGLRSTINDLVYDGMFEVAIYSDNSSKAKSSTTMAGTMVIGAQVIKLLHQAQLSGATIKTEFQTEFQTESNVTGVKKYVQRYKVSEVIG